MARVASLIAVGALVVAGCGSDSADEGAARAAVEDYLAALRAHDPGAACALLTRAELADLDRSGGCAEVFAAGFELFAEEGVEIPAYEIAAVEVDGSSAEATLLADATEEVVPLEREDDAWKLAGTTSLSDFHPDDPIP